VVALVLQQGLFVAIFGMLVGCVLAIFAARLVAGALYGVGVGDPVSWAAAVLTLLMASALANLIPAWRASRVDPSVALRIE
jgi:putative ABC transport system permease protein